MKRILLYCLFIVNTSCTKDDIVKGTDFFQLMGRVKLVTEKSYKAVKTENGVWVRDPQDTLDLFSFISFDESGNPIDEKRYSPQTGKYKLVYSYTYSEGRPDKVFYYDYDENISRTEKVEKSHGGFQIEEIRIISPRSSANEKTLLQWEGNQLRQVVTNTATTINEYNEKGFMTRQIVSRKNKADDVTTFEYLSFDPEGNWTKQVLHNPFTNSEFITERKISYY